MAKIIQLKKVPDEQNLKRMLSDLSDMRPRTSSLMSLLDVLQAGIATARSKGVEWEDIAKYVSKETETEINPDTIAQSYAAMIREQKNSERAEGELTYTQLKYRYKIAINLLKKSGKTEVDIENIIEKEKERKRKNKDNMTKNDKSIQEQNQSDNTDSSSESEVKINNESESRTNGTVIEEHRKSVADNKGNASKETATERPLDSYQPLNPNDF